MGLFRRLEIDNKMGPGYGRYLLLAAFLVHRQAKCGLHHPCRFSIWFAHWSMKHQPAFFFQSLGRHCLTDDGYTSSTFLDLFLPKVMSCGRLPDAHLDFVNLPQEEESSDSKLVKSLLD